MDPVKHRYDRMDYSVSVRPMDVIAGYPVRPGYYDMNGATALDVGVNFTIYTIRGTSVELLLFRRGEKEPFAVLPFPEKYKIGNVYSMLVLGLKYDEFEYAYRIDGPWDLQKGYRFDKTKILLDPYAKAVTGQGVWGMRDPDEGYRARVVRDSFEWGDMPQSTKKMSDLIIYELHVRGFTRHASSGVRHPGTFAGLIEKIPYLKELGINAVELMPIFEFDETVNAREVNGSHLLEYWGYNSVCFFAPNTSYASTREYHREGTELKQMIKAFHDNGIEVILDVVFNHTAEGNENGPVISFKGIDNQLYYMLTPEGFYYNFSGCGNTLNCNQPVVRRMILDCLRYWTIDYRVDGFRFDLASILGRNEDGSPMNEPPLLEALAYDPVLGNVKLIAEAWDAGGLYQVGKFPASKRWAEWNGRYRDTVRGFLKGDCWNCQEAAWSICGSGDMYGGVYSDGNDNYAGYNSCVNFLTCHDGFTLYDLYAYNSKHNEANGWNNSDGTDDNRSWNCGAEGETSDPEVLSLRFRMIRSACAVLMCSRGTPMFLAGDEFGNSQSGNNNAYCQDNEISWLDWGLLQKNHDLFEFFKFMIAFRKKHPVISRKLPDAICGMEPLQTHSVNADVTVLPPNARTIGISMAGYNREKGHDDLVYLAINTYWEDVTVTLPQPRGRVYWYLAVNTAGDGRGRYCYEERQAPHIDHEFVMRPRSVAVFYGGWRR